MLHRVLGRVVTIKGTKSFATMSTSKKIVGVCQMRSTNDKESNRQQVAELVSRAKSKQADFLFFPECCDYVGTNAEETKSLSEPITGETVRFYKDLCRTNELWVSGVKTEFFEARWLIDSFQMSFGGIHEQVPGGEGKVYNTHVIINSR